MNLTLVAKITAKAGKAKELKTTLEGLIAPTRAEKGCMEYYLNYSIEEEGVFLFYETWATVEDWNVHMESDHLKAFFAKEEELIESVEISKWEKSAL
ncbi:antibiotic biosynthesis monooxygenase [Puteibacter caeruleilacunae]|nr:antibiotic biosynthesis monooxygenase [Puteibacter caeruleilacunae]